jgi:hypothetical protein
MPVAAGQGDGLDRAAPGALLQLPHGFLQPLLADPLVRRAVQLLAKRILQGAFGIVTPALEVAEAQGLIEVGAHVIEQLIEVAPPGPFLDALPIPRLLLQQLGLQPAHHHPQQHIIQAQLHRQGGMAAEAGIQMVQQGVQLPGLHAAQFPGGKAAEVGRTIRPLVQGTGVAADRGSGVGQVLWPQDDHG